MSGGEMSPKSMLLILFGITAAVIFNPLRPEKTGLGVGVAQATLSGAYAQHCQGVLVSKMDSPALCVAGPCTSASISSPELDFLGLVGEIKFFGSSVTSTLAFVSVSDRESPSSASPSSDNMFDIEWIINAGTITYGTGGAPPDCFIIAEIGSVVVGPITICFIIHEKGCMSEVGSEAATQFTLLEIGTAPSPSFCPATTFVKEPIELQCVLDHE